MCCYSIYFDVSFTIRSLYHVLYQKALMHSISRSKKKRFIQNSNHVEFCWLDSWANGNDAVDNMGSLMLFILCAYVRFGVKMQCNAIQWSGLFSYNIDTLLSRLQNIKEKWRSNVNVLKPTFMEIYWTGRL